MPKGRHLKPDFFTDKHIVAVSPLARLLYQGLWCYAADCGHLDDEPVELKMRILPADNCDVDALLDELAWHQRIERNGGVIFVPNLAKHSRVDKRYETKCEACRLDVTTTSDPTPSTPNTKRSRRDHDVTTQGPQRDHDADGDGDGDGDGDVSALVAANAAPKRANPRGTRRPDDFRPTEAHIALANELGIDLRAEWAKFVDYCDANGKTYKDWPAALRNWIRNAKTYSRPAARRNNDIDWDAALAQAAALDAKNGETR